MIKELIEKLLPVVLAWVASIFKKQAANAFEKEIEKEAIAEKLERETKIAQIKQWYETRKKNTPDRWPDDSSL